MGDIVALAAEIEREREARENATAQERAASPLGASQDSRPGMGTQDATLRPGSDTSAAKDAESDVKMEG